MTFFLLDGRGVWLLPTIFGFQAILDVDYDEGCDYGQGLTAEEALDDLLYVISEREG